MLIAEGFEIWVIEQEIEILTPHKMKLFHGPSAMITEVPSDEAKNPLTVYKIPFGIRIN